MTFEERQDLLRLLVDRITVGDETVRVETIIPSGDDHGQLRTRRGEPVEPRLWGQRMLHALATAAPGGPSFDKSDFVETRDLRSELRMSGFG